MLVKDTKGRVLTDVHGRPMTTKDRWHPKLQKYLTAVTKSQGKLSSILPYAEMLNQKLWQSNGNLMFLTYENSTELGMRIQTDSGQDWEVDWQGDGNWETYESSTTEQIKIFGSATSGVALFRTTNNDISEVQSTTGNWIFDISIFKGINYLYLQGGSITATGNIGDLAGINYLRLVGNSITATGNIGDLAGINYLRLQGGSITATGNIGDLAGINYLYLVGNSITATGNIGDLAGINDLRLEGSSITATGNIGDLAGINYLYLQGGSITATGNIGDLAGINYLYLQGGSITATYTSTSWSNVPSNIFNLLGQATGLTATEVDNIFIDLADASTIPTSGNRLIQITGNNAAPTAASLTARNFLISQGYSITVNS